MPWQEKQTSSPFDIVPQSGLYFLDGDVLAKRYQIERTHGQKYPVITYPSGITRELSDTTSSKGTINIFGAFDLSRVGTRDDGFTQAQEFAEEYGYRIERRGEIDLYVYHPDTLQGYGIRYDNRIGQIANIKRIPEHAMDLLDAESRGILPPLYANEKLGMDASALVKFFTPDSNWTWYATEYDGKDVFFGLVAGFELELGYFSYVELESVRGSLGLSVERDLYFPPTPLRKLKAEHE